MPNARKSVHEGWAQCPTWCQTWSQPKKHQNFQFFEFFLKMLFFQFLTYFLPKMGCFYRFLMGWKIIILASVSQ